MLTPDNVLVPAPLCINPTEPAKIADTVAVLLVEGLSVNPDVLVNIPPEPVIEPLPTVTAPMV